MNKVTVFMPVYNGEKYIKQAIDSILNQSYTDFELLIIDDGSTDNTVNIISAYTDSRIRLLCNKKNMGIPFTRNRGLEEARGEYFAIMDADDIAYPDRLQLQVNYLDNNLDINIVTASYYVMRKNIDIRKVVKKDNDEYIRASLLFDSYLCNPSTMFRTNLRETYKYNEQCIVCQDYDFWIQLMEKNKFGAIEKPLLRYRTGHMNITRKTNKEKQLLRNEILFNIRKKSFLINGFLIANDELLVLNNLLDFNNRSLDKVIKSLPILEGIIRQNNEKNIFRNEILIQVITNMLIKQLSMCNSSLSEKIELVKKFEKFEIHISNILIFKCHIASLLRKSRRL